LGEDVTQRVARGRALLDVNDPRSIALLRDAAQSGLTLLNEVAGKNMLAAAPSSLMGDVVTATLAQKVAEAHFFWGLAADRFARRDESITALTRAVRLSRALTGASVDGGNLRRDSALELGRTLREGLPLTAPDDVLDGIASIAHGGLWTPRRVALDATPLGGAKSEFLITTGKLFPPVDTARASLSRIPPLYQGVPTENLPPALQLDKMVAGYARETAGANRGQWRQVVRVFYASPFVTTSRRDDLPRAQALCEQFLKVQSLFKSQLGATNLYARGDKIEGVTTLYLLEISALWPQDDQDPAILAQLGPLMPALNTGKFRQQPQEVEVTALMRPWMPIAGQVESEPGEILFWKASLARPESEWVRELFHEYGHVALPPIGGFRAPLEPFANGAMGETLGALWAAALPDRFAPPPGLPAGTSNALAQVNAQALPTMQYFLRSGPNSPLRSTGTPENWRYLQGLTTYLERVYGARMLGNALAPLSRRAADVSNVAARRSLMTTQTLLDSLPSSWRNPWRGAKTLPIWLPGALEIKLNAATLVSRGEATLARGTRAQGLLFVPPGTDSLRIEGTGVAQMRAIGWPFQASGNGVRVYFGGRSGWQNLALQAGSAATISAARFERK
jgi:hypothetical protein